MFPIINTCLKTYLEYVTQYVQANACIRSKRALCKLEGRMHDRGCNFFLSGVHGCVSIVYWMQVWIWRGPLLPCSWPLPSIQTQQLGRCTLSRAPLLHICAGIIYKLCQYASCGGMDLFDIRLNFFFFFSGAISLEGTETPKLTK